jgi:hypothetical protein
LDDSSRWDFEALGNEVGVNIDQLDIDPDSGELNGARIWVASECYLDVAAVKAGLTCQEVELNGPITIFSDVASPSISHFEVIAVCCRPN